MKPDNDNVFERNVAVNYAAFIMQKIEAYIAT